MKLYDFVKQKQISKYELDENFKLNGMKILDDINSNMCSNCNDNRCTLLPSEFGSIVQFCFVCKSMNFILLKSIITNNAYNKVWIYKSKQSSQNKRK